MPIRRKSKKIKKSKKRQTGSGMVEADNKTKLINKFLNKVKNFLKTKNSLIKSDSNLENITKLAKQKRGRIYDFIFDSKESNKALIWSHGDKSNLEPITAGKKGLHVYVVINNNSIELLGIILNTSG